MILIGAVVVGLLLAVVGLLAGLFVQGARRAELAEEAAHRAAEEAVIAEQRYREQAEHLDAALTILVDRMWLVAAGLAAEMRQIGIDQRNDQRLALGLAPLAQPSVEAHPHGARSARPSFASRTAKGRVTARSAIASP